jgi:hypothetical protein
VILKSILNSRSFGLIRTNPEHTYLVCCWRTTLNARVERLGRKAKTYYARLMFQNREFKLHVSGNGKRQVRIFLANSEFSLKVFVSYFLSCVERIVMHFIFKTASSFTLYCLIRENFLCLPFAVSHIREA